RIAARYPLLGLAVVRAHRVKERMLPHTPHRHMWDSAEAAPARYRRFLEDSRRNRLPSRGERLCFRKRGSKARKPFLREVEAAHYSIDDDLHLLSGDE